MKFIAAGLFIAFLSISGQGQPDNRVHFACTAVTPIKLLKCQTTLGFSNLRILFDDRRYASGAEFARKAQVGDLWWPGGPDTIVVTLAADNIRQERREYRLTGNSEIHTSAMTLEADDAVYHSDTGEIESHGNVRVKPAGGAH